MIKLLIHDRASAESSPQTRFGGLPVVPEGADFSWPVCKVCDGPMQFLGRILSSTSEQRLVLLFMCQNDPGMCDDWEADGGGNAALVVQAFALRPISPPEDGDTLRTTTYGSDIVEIDAPDYDAAWRLWTEQTGRSPRHVLGQVSGSPDWLQADETPSCDCCQQPMQFLAQLNQGPEHETEMNFGGGGIAYAFVCSSGKPEAKFLWQC